MKSIHAFSLLLILGFNHAIASTPIQFGQHQSINTDDSIAFYEKKLQQHPTLAPAKAALGTAYLKKASETYDPSWLKKARETLNASNALQTNLNAYQGLANVANYTHHFRDAIKYADLGLQAAPNNPQLINVKVEAYLGLHNLTAARNLLPKTLAEADNFYTASALGQWYSTNKEYTKARQAFQHATQLANKEAASALAIWATISEAGTQIDSGQLKEGQAILNRIKDQAGNDKNFLIHQSEIYMANQQYDQAIACYQAILAETEDASIHHLLYIAAKANKQKALADEQYTLAMKSYTAIRDAGEIYTLHHIDHLQQGLALPDHHH